MVTITNGERPLRPANPMLTDGLWTLTQRCWDPEARRRPKMLEVLQVLLDLLVPVLDHVSSN